MLDRFVTALIRPPVDALARGLVRLGLGADRITCDARELADAQIDRYWPRLVALWPAYRQHYGRSGDRTVFVLEPRV